MCWIMFVDVSPIRLWWLDTKIPKGNLQSLSVPKWKWKQVTMYFVVGLPKSSPGHNSICVILDWLAKSMHFIPIKLQPEPKISTFIHGTNNETILGSKGNNLWLWYKVYFSVMKVGSCSI